jgi:hypothetical protein
VAAAPLFLSLLKTPYKIANIFYNGLTSHIDKGGTMDDRKAPPDQGELRQRKTNRVLVRWIIALTAWHIIGTTVMAVGNCLFFVDVANAAHYHANLFRWAMVMFMCVGGSFCFVLCVSVLAVALKLVAVATKAGKRPADVWRNAVANAK